MRLIKCSILALLVALKNYQYISAQENDRNRTPFFDQQRTAFLSNHHRKSSTTSSSYSTPRKKDSKMCAWRCHGKNQKDLVNRLFQADIIKSDSVRDAMSRVDRKNYVAESAQANAHMDAPQPIGKGQTISAPHMHAHMLEEMYPFLKKSKDREIKILDVGSGSGYLTATLARWVAPLEKDGPKSRSSFLDENKTGKVYGIEIHQELVDLARDNVKREDKDLLDNGILSLQKADGWKGLPDEGPFDAIHVGAAAEGFPRPLLEQLKVGGVLIIPIGPEYGGQFLYRVERTGDGVTADDFRMEELLEIRFVPLVKQD